MKEDFPKIELPNPHEEIRIQTPDDAAVWTQKLRAINATFHRIADAISAYLERGGAVPDGYLLKRNDKSGRHYLRLETPNRDTNTGKRGQ